MGMMRVEHFTYRLAVDGRGYLLPFNWFSLPGPIRNKTVSVTLKFGRLKPGWGLVRVWTKGWWV